jgi:hypothetical protein
LENALIELSGIKGAIRSVNIVFFRLKTKEFVFVGNLPYNIYCVDGTPAAEDGSASALTDLP